MNFTFLQSANSPNHSSTTKHKHVEKHYKLGQDYKDEIIDLLEKLMSITSWEEALARAITEILEYNWFKKFPQLYEKLNNISLWPAQSILAFYQNK
ncbi:MAG: hypothetical protein V7K89_05255 [Nostoc sp.]|uniref:hypothetical protein n=1 Tax=Nostoc sp. TaxID=1180 RepID=UPI002FF9D6A0